MRARNHINGLQTRAAPMPVKRWTKQVLAQSWSFSDNLLLGRTQNLLELCQRITRVSPSTSSPDYWFGHGFHFLNNTQNNQDLGVDGYDNYQAPKDEKGTPIFRRRMWVGGTISNFGNPMALGEVIVCEEKIGLVKTIGGSTFVKIDRVFSTTVPVLEELRTLVYTKEDFVENKKEMELPQYPEEKLEISLTRTDLRRYSALTNNLHKIHMDTEYARGYEHLPDVIVHGPFMVSLLLYWIGCRQPIKSFKYKNIYPCVVGEPMTLVQDNNTLMIVNYETGKKFIEGKYS